MSPPGNDSRVYFIKSLLSTIFLLIKIFIPELDVEALRSCPSLETADLQENPLTTVIRSALENVTSIKITWSRSEAEDWDDLNV